MTHIHIMSIAGNPQMKYNDKICRRSRREDIQKEEKEKVVKKTIVLTSPADEGINTIKEILSVEGVNIRYLGSSQFSLVAQGKDFREANQKIAMALDTIEKRAKEKKTHLEIKETKS